LAFLAWTLRLQAFAVEISINDRLLKRSIGLAK
jgi:hypothetical protein